MCSTIAKTLYFLLLIIALILTAASLLTPAWRTFKLKDAVQQVKHGDFSFGLITRICGPKDTSKTLEDQCQEAFDKKATWEKASLVCVALSVLSLLLAVAWSIVFCCACCCRSCLAPPLPVFTGLAALLLATGTTVYAVMSKQHFDWKFPNEGKDWETIDDFGYSLWLAIGGIAADILATIFGIFVVHTYEPPRGSVV